MAKQQKKPRRTETQHYVPQLYLRGFTNASGGMRTKTYRDMAYETITKGGQSLVDDLIQLNNIEVPMTFSVERGGMSALHAQQIFDQALVERMAGDIERHYWVIGVNDTPHLFYTSDHPVVRRGNRTAEDGRVLLGPRDPGFEFVFPLDSRHVLLILERTYFANWRQHDNMAVPLTAEQVSDYNRLQVMRSCQRVYCAEDDFELVRQVCRDHPEVRDPARPRVRVDSTPVEPTGVGEQMRSFMYVTALE